MDITYTTNSGTTERLSNVRVVHIESMIRVIEDNKNIDVHIAKDISVMAIDIKIPIRR